MYEPQVKVSELFIILNYNSVYVSVRVKVLCEVYISTVSYFVLPIET